MLQLLSSAVDSAVGLPGAGSNSREFGTPCQYLCCSCINYVFWFCVLSCRVFVTECSWSDSFKITFKMLQLILSEKNYQTLRNN